MFKAIYTIVHNQGITHAAGFHRSVKKAIAIASNEAWSNYTASNYAHCWLHIYKYGRLIHSDWAD
jgi:hypothetical protein